MSPPDPLGHPPTGAGESPTGEGGTGPDTAPRVVIACLLGQLRTEVVDAALRSGLPVVIQATDPADQGGYARLLCRLWRAPWEWVLLEQDTVPPDGALAAMLACEAPWCTLPHWVGTHWEMRSLGVARFGLQLRRQLPHVADQVLGPPWPGQPFRDWRILDTQLAGDMAIRGLVPHVHPGRTRHLHQYALDLGGSAPGTGPEA